LCLLQRFGSISGALSLMAADPHGWREGGRVIRPWMALQTATINSLHPRANTLRSRPARRRSSIFPWPATCTAPASGRYSCLPEIRYCPRREWRALILALRHFGLQPATTSSTSFSASYWVRSPRFPSRPSWSSRLGTRGAKLCLVGRLRSRHFWSISSPALAQQRETQVLATLKKIKK
jgi:hypothetical protein